MQRFKGESNAFASVFILIGQGQNLSALMESDDFLSHEESVIVLIKLPRLQVAANTRHELS